MKNDVVTTEIIVKENKIGIMRVGNVNYISLTDLARYKDKERTDYIIQNWMRTTNTILYLGTWEYLNNQNFNSIEFDGFKNESGTNAFVMTPKKWIVSTNAIGIISKQGRYNGGTFAHPDIAFEFASWLSPEFKLYLITEFERLKTNEAYQYKIEWSATRLLSKVNYVVHTDAIKKCIVPTLTEKQKQFVYAEEADVLNVALFGMTAKEWRDSNSKLAEKGNMRDYTDLLHLVILNNLQNTNAELIEEKVSQRERLIRLNNSARRQMEALKDNKSLKDLELLQKQVNENNMIEQ
ncbi:MAG: KilA-N domain-containing protein [Clostridium sp.]|nr:KilA-N domain-containing protein [Clostridium sp.]